MISNIEIVNKYWRCFAARKYSEAAHLMSDAIEIFWPNTSEKFNKAQFVEINANYPGVWKIVVEKTMAINVNEVVVIGCAKSQEKSNIAARTVSFFEIEQDKITRLTEYWGDITEPPVWRL